MIMPYSTQIKNTKAAFDNVVKQMQEAKDNGQDEVYKQLAVKRVSLHEEITRLQKLQWDETHHRFDMDDR
jgi:hypothetical protein